MYSRRKLRELNETISYVMAYAPDHFPKRDFQPPDGQWNLERLYSKLRKDFEELAYSFGENPPLDECRAGIEKSYESYVNGDNVVGLLQIQAVLHRILEL